GARRRTVGQGGLMHWGEEFKKGVEAGVREGRGSAALALPVPLHAPRRQLEIALLRTDPVLVALGHQGGHEMERIVLEAQHGRTVRAWQEGVAEDERRLRRLDERHDGRGPALADATRVPALTVRLDDTMHRD